MEANELQARLMEFATFDIETVEKNRVPLYVTQTKKGTVVISRKGNGYTIYAEGAINFVTAERDMELLFEGAKEGAIIYLAGLYDVVQG